MESNGRGNQQEENIREAVLKLTTLSGKHQGMDAAPQTHHLPVAMETNSKGNYGEAVALVHLCPYVSLYKVMMSTVLCLNAEPPVPMHPLTFVVGGVIDGEISVPDDGQLHG